MKKQLILGCAASVAVAALCVNSSWSQQSNYGGQSTLSDAAATDLFNTYVTQDDSQNGPANRLAAIRADIQKIVQQLQKTDDAIAKEELAKKLDAAIADQFDEDLKAREAALVALEQRLDKLRSQLARRRKAKAEITQLHAQVLINEAEGLGFSAGLTVPDGRGFDLNPFEPQPDDVPAIR
jgi:type I site-specific restriction-modification system R (restriction) subunit